MENSFFLPGNDINRANTQRQLLSNSMPQEVGWIYLIIKDFVIYKSFVKLTISTRFYIIAAFHPISLLNYFSN